MAAKCVRCSQHTFSTARYITIFFIDFLDTFSLGTESIIDFRMHSDAIGINMNVISAVECCEIGTFLNDVATTY